MQYVYCKSKVLLLLAAVSLISLEGLIKKSEVK